MVLVGRGRRLNLTSLAANLEGQEERSGKATTL